jgi:hypothetical protein
MIDLKKIIAKNLNLVDFLSLDAEVSKIEVLKGIDRNKFRFKCICRV